MRVKMAQHLGLFRDGKLFAEAIPVDADSVLDDLKAAIAESHRRQAAAAGRKH